MILRTGLATRILMAGEAAAGRCDMAIGHLSILANLSIIMGSLSKS